MLIGSQLVALLAELSYQRVQREQQWYLEQQQREQHEQLGSPRPVETF
jgi:hypothetical protein